MQRLISRLRRFAVVVMATIVPASAPALAEEIPFRATANDEVTYLRGSYVEGGSSGIAFPGGKYTAKWTEKFTGWTAVGIDTWTFSGGDTLTWAFVTQPHPDDRFGNLWVGTYVVIGGTGRFEGFMGSADFLLTGHGDGTGEYILEGTLSR